MNLQIIKRKVVTPPRFELELAVPKTAVLPLHHRVLNCLYYNANIQKVKYKNKKISVFLPTYSVWHQKKKSAINNRELLISQFLPENGGS